MEKLFLNFDCCFSTERVLIQNSNSIKRLIRFTSDLIFFNQSQYFIQFTFLWESNKNACGFQKFKAELLKHGRVVNKLFIVGVFNLNFNSYAIGCDEQKYICTMSLRLNFMEKCSILNFSEN